MISATGMRSPESSSNRRVATNTLIRSFVSGSGFCFPRGSYSKRQCAAVSTHSLKKDLRRDGSHNKCRFGFLIDPNAVHFIDMRSFARCSQRRVILFDIWHMVLYSIRKVRKERSWKHVILGKAISVREMKMCVQKLHPTLTTRLAIKQQPMIKSLWNKRQTVSYE